MYLSSLRVGYGTGRTSEQITVWHNGSTAGKLAVVLCHGFLGDATQWFDSGIPLIARGLASAGLVALGPDLGQSGADNGNGLNGLNNWGHDDTVDPGGAIDDAWAWAVANLGVRSDKLGLHGTSMGGTAAAWIWRNLANFAAASFTIPAVATAALHAENPLGLATYMDLAFAAEGGFAASVPTHDPSYPTNAALLATVADRIGVWYSGDDTVISATDVQAFAAATGCHAVNVGNVGHTVSATTSQDVLDWFVPRLWSL
jgi:dienelactone hydrolase